MNAPLRFLSALLVADMLVGFSFAQVSQTFNYTGSPQTFTIPPNVFSITVDVKGASGGDAKNLSAAPTIGTGGKGGRVQGTIAVNPGDVLNIYVGGRGTSDSAALACMIPAGGFNGGGAGYGGYNSFNYNAGGGGGASDVRLNGSILSNRIFVAGGGGGGACTGCSGGGVNGGDGGGLTGTDGQNSTCFSNMNNGKGGTQSAGGAAGAWAGACTNSTAGSLGLGGRGNDSAGCSGGVTCGSGGGGGSGYYGGGGGGNGPGGGGSSYASTLATGVTHTAGYQSGNGQVIISYTVSTASGFSASSEAYVNVYPNPFTDNISIFINLNNFKAGIKVSNILGEMVYSGYSSSSHTSVDLSQFPSGIYFVKVLLPDATVTKKVIKK